MSGAGAVRAALAFFVCGVDGRATVAESADALEAFRVLTSPTATLTTEPSTPMDPPSELEAPEAVSDRVEGEPIAGDENITAAVAA